MTKPTKKTLAICLGLQTIPLLFNHFLTSAAFPNAIGLQIIITRIMSLICLAAPLSWLYAYNLYHKKQEKTLWQEQGRTIMDLAKNNNGIVDVSALAQRLNMSQEDAEKLLVTWTVSGTGLNLEISEDGNLCYAFSSMREDRLKARIEHLADEVEEVPVTQSDRAEKRI